MTFIVQPNELGHVSVKPRQTLARLKLDSVGSVFYFIRLMPQTFQSYVSFSQKKS